MKIELITLFKRRATKIITELHNTKEPMLIMEHGKPSAYLISAGEYESMQKRLVILEDIVQSEPTLAKLADGKIVSDDKAKSEVSR